MKWLAHGEHSPQGPPKWMTGRLDRQVVPASTGSFRPSLCTTARPPWPAGPVPALGDPSVPPPSPPPSEPRAFPSQTERAPLGTGMAGAPRAYPPPAASSCGRLTPELPGGMGLHDHCPSCMPRALGGERPCPTFQVKAKPACSRGSTCEVHAPWGLLVGPSPGSHCGGTQHPRRLPLLVREATLRTSVAGGECCLLLIWLMGSHSYAPTFTSGSSAQRVPPGIPLNKQICVPFHRCIVFP